MNASLQVIDVTDKAGNVVEPDWLGRSESVHRQLRPQLPRDYADKMRRVFTQGGRMCAATIGDAVVGVAVYRIHENTHAGLHLYVDDLVTDETRRSSGVGKALMAHLRTLARAAHCEHMTLDSGTQRQQAHKFYFREGMVVTAFHFAEPLR
jgi:GNAT superfamily N-acetyltransferase